MLPQIKAVLAAAVKNENSILYLQLDKCYIFRV